MIKKNCALYCTALHCTALHCTVLYSVLEPNLPNLPNLSQTCLKLKLSTIVLHEMLIEH